VKAIEAHISDKEAAYQSNISVLYISALACVTLSTMKRILIFLVKNRVVTEVSSLVLF
jgi:hypothetical protein